MQTYFSLAETAYMRMHLGLTQQQLANSLGMSRSALAMAEAGLRPMPEFALPFLKEMATIVKKMPAPAITTIKRNLRVVKSARWHTLSRQPSVTGQSSTASSYRQALSNYTAGSTKVHSFSTNLLQSNVECQQLTSRFAVQQERIHYQLEYLQLEATQAINRGKEIKLQLGYVNTMIQCNLQIMDQLPARKRKLEHRNAKLYCKKLQLEDRLGHFDQVAMVSREYTINTMVRELEVLDKLIAAVEVGRTEIQKGQLTIIKPTPIAITGAIDRAALQQRA